MAFPRTRLLAPGVTAAGVVAVAITAGWLNAAEPPAGKADAVPGQSSGAGKPAAEMPPAGTAGEKGAEADPAPNGDATAKGDSHIRVEAPDTKVTVDKDTGKVDVTAPHTEVQADPEKGRVRVRAPFVNLDIQW